MDDDELHEVRLLDVPVRVLIATREHHDELMREFALLALATRSGDDVPTRLVELTQVLGVRYAGAAARPDEAVDEAQARGADTVDLIYSVPAHVIGAADIIDQLMNEADEFCRSEQLLTLARTDTMVEFANWYLDEFRRQVGGAEPRPWAGPLDPA